VIVITASRDADVAATLRKFAVVEILHKPVGAGAVLAAVDRALAGV
jgi:FixJ family two-component response regulator